MGAGNASSIAAGTHLLVRTAARQLTHYQGERVVEVFPVAVGKPSTPTPAGKYRIVNKLMNPGGVLGTRWMGLDIPGGNYGIHGTNNPDSIGKAISNGCIRMHNHDIERLFPQVQIGTPVVIVAEPAKEKGRTYTVRPGDTLWAIAGRFGIPLEILVQANPQINPQEIFPGQVIAIPI